MDFPNCQKMVGMKRMNSGAAVRIEGDLPPRDTQAFRKCPSKSLEWGKDLLKAAWQIGYKVRTRAFFFFLFFLIIFLSDTLQ